MSTSREVNHALFLRLACYGNRQWLLHTGTGERISLAPGEWSLHIGEEEHEGVGALSCVKPDADPELYWANTLLTLSLHVIERDGTEVSRVIHQAGADHKDVLAAAFDVTPKLLQLGEIQNNTLDIEIYWHALMYGHCKAFWGLQRVVHFVFPRDSYLQKSFITRKVVDWTTRLRALGLADVTCIRTSRMGWETASATVAGSRYPELSHAEQEWSMNTVTLVGWLVGLLWSKGNASHVIGVGTQQSHPLLVLDVVCRKLLGANVYEISSAAPPFATSITSTSIDVERFEMSLQGWLRQDVLRMQLAREMSLPALLSQLCFAFTCLKQKPGVKARLQGLLVALVTEIGTLLDILLEPHLSTDFTDMTVELGRTGKRALRTSQSYKTTMSALARRKANKRGFLQGFGESTRKRRRLVSGAPEYVVHERSSQKHDRERLYGHLCAQREKGHGRTVSLSFDGVRAIGRECVSGVLQWPDSNIATWCPVQVKAEENTGLHTNAIRYYKFPFFAQGQRLRAFGSVLAPI
eukprot:6255395-Amphidinium_carterae.4